MEKDRRNDIAADDEKNSSSRIRKKNNVQRFADSIISEDIADIKTYVKSEVVIPAIKKTISDIVSGVFDIIRNSVDTALFGESNPRRNGRYSSRTPYNSMYDNRNSVRREYDTRRMSVFDYEYIEHDTRGKAEWILNELREDIREYNFARVADLFSLSDMDPPSVSENYGWTDLSRASVKYERGKYVIKLPRAIPRD